MEKYSRGKNPNSHIFGKFLPGKENAAKRTEVREKISEALKGNQHTKGKHFSNPACSNSLKNYWDELKEDPISCRKKSKSISEGVKRWLNKPDTKNKIANRIANHHIYLKQNGDETIPLSYKKHMLIHQKAYDYILEKFGKTEIDFYIEWFKKKFSDDEVKDGKES